jgi:hypothetical protein
MNISSVGLVCDFSTYGTGPGMGFFISYPSNLAGTGNGYLCKNFHTSLVLGSKADFCLEYGKYINLVLILV